MTRVSLKEAYDNKDVVAQIYAIRDIAEGAEDTADSAVTTANTASEHVDALVPQVEGAVENANNASASAQTSAQTVAGYENRLSAVEGETAGLDSDLNAVTLRVTTAEGQIVTIQGRVTALETADGQNVKLSGNQNITGIKNVPTEATGSRSQQIANSAKIGAELDNYAPMVRTTGNTIKSGSFTLTTPQGLIASASANYNNILLESSTQYNRLISRVRNNDATLFDTHFDLGTVYVTTGVNNVGLRAFAPRTVFGDTSETQALIGVSLHIENNDTGYVTLSFTKRDGTQKTMRLGTFDGTNWS